MKQPKRGRPQRGAAIFFKNQNVARCIDVQGDVCLVYHHKARTWQWFNWKTTKLFDWQTKTKPTEQELLYEKLGVL